MQGKSGREQYIHQPEISENNPDIDSLVAAIEEGNHQIVLMILWEIKDVNGTNREGTTPLIATINKHDDSTFELILRAKDVDINCPDKDGRTPLWHAIKSNNRKASFRLVYLGAK